MALTNCELHPVSTLEQAELQTPGQTGIAPYYFYIKPMEGYVVDKDDFENNTFEHDPTLIGKIDSIDLSNTGEDGEYDVDNKIKVTVTLSPTYSISEDTQLVIDIDGRAISMGSRKIHISVVHDCRDLKSHSYEDGGDFVSGDMQIQMDIEIHDGGASGFNDQTMEQGVEENTTMEDIHPYGVTNHGYVPGDGLMPDNTAEGVGHAFSSPNLGGYDNATGRDDVVVFKWTGIPNVQHRVATITFTPVVAQSLIDQGVAGSFNAIPSLNFSSLMGVQNYIPTESGFSIADSIEHFELVPSTTTGNDPAITYEDFESNPNAPQITKCVMDLLYTPPLGVPTYNASVDILDYNGDDTDTVNWRPYFTTNIDIRGALSIKNTIEEDCTLWITAPALANPAYPSTNAYQLSELVNPSSSSTWAQFPTGQEIGDGEANTSSMYYNQQIVPSPTLQGFYETSAVQAAKDHQALSTVNGQAEYINDWFLPSLKELEKLHLANQTSPGLVTGYGGADLAKVWSSTGYVTGANYQVYYLEVSSGSTSAANVDDQFRVIPIRSQVYDGDMDGVVIGASMLGGKVFYLEGDCSGGGGFTDPQTGERFSINKVDFNFDKLPHGSRNIIPTGGIDKSNQPIVEIHGTPGSSFSVVFKETAVREGLTGRSSGSNTVDFFGGIIPDMPEGIVKIPKSGIYVFNFPAVAAWDTSVSETGWKEFDMIITAGSDTLIKSNIKNSGSLARNKSDVAITSTVGELGASITNKFYQYPKVNIKIDATIHSGASYITSPTNYHINQVAASQYFGGSGTSKIGSAGSYIDNKYDWYTEKILPSSEPFEIRITKGGTTFSLNTENTEAVYDSNGVQIEEGGSGDNYKFYSFDSSVIKASVENNKDDVSFTRLRAHVGNGIGDGTVTHVTITGTIHYNKFGLQDQIHTIDLTQIFNNV